MKKLPDISTDPQNKFLNYFKKEIMDMCIQEGLHQVDLLSPAETKITQLNIWRKNPDRKN